MQDAQVKPETFRPVCGLTFSLLTRGNAMFKNGFGWYNASPGKKPDPSDLHLLVDCNTADGTKTPFNMLADPASDSRKTAICRSHESRCRPGLHRR